jgi:hypothetical protein
MAFTPPATFVLGNPALASEVQANLDALRNYVCGGAVPADLRTTPKWVERKHLVRGTYLPQPNRLELISGVSAGFHRSASTRLPTYATIANSDKLQSGSETLVAPVPLTTIDFVMERAGDVRFSFWGQPVVSDQDMPAAAQGSAWAEVVLNDGATGEVRYASSRSWTFEERRVTAEATDRQPWQCLAIIRNLAAGTHNIGLQGGATALRCAMLAWGCTLQAWYRFV